MRFRLLGPMRIQANGAPVRITAPKQRTVLAMLLARAGHVVPIRSLVAEVWDERPPRSAVANLRTYLMQLRKLLPDEERLVTADVGYLLRAGPEELDLFEFEALSARGRQALARRDLSAAEEAFTRALALWDGTAAEDVPLGPTLREVVARLTDHYLGVVEEHADIQLALGRNATAATRLREVIGQYPLRERLHGQLMVALYRSGDVVGALDAFGAARRVLADELGIDPGPDLRQLQQAILRRDTALLAADRDTAAVPVDDGHSRPRLLPRAPMVFVGRSAELAHLHTVLHEGAGPSVVALHGPGGAGKSALTLKAAHGVADRYPDGQLYVDLQGSTPGLPPLRPAEVLGRFLRALGVPPGDVPATPAEAATHYQSLLADRRVLIVLDNAVDAAQVAPLLPAGSGCAALVTSRAALTTMEAVPIAVGMLDEAESVRLLTLLTSPERVTAEAEAAAEIARWCGYHPLALRIAGARLAGRPDWSLARFGERLGNQQRRLDELQAADLRVRTCFEVGYGTLTSTAKAAFRVFGVLEVPEVGVELTAALADVDQTRAEAALDELTEARLLEPVGDGRFRMHDLLRLFAAELAAAHNAPEERTRAVGRALDWYLDRCRQLQGLLQPHLRPTSGGTRESGAGLRDLPAAVRWLDTELPCLVAAAVQAAKGEPGGFVVELMALIKAIAMKSGYWRELETIARLAVEVARRDGDRAAEAPTLATLGLVEWRSGRPEAAHGLLRRALDLWRDMGERGEEGLALHNLGWLCMQTGDLDAALDHISAGLLLLEAHGSNRVGLVAHNLGEVLLRLGRYTEAVDRFERCLSIRRADRDLYGESITLAALGRAHCLLDQREEALAVLAEALVRCAETGNREDQWEVLLSRSEIRLRQDDPAAAAADLDRVLELTTKIGDAYGHAAGIRQLARARAVLGDPRAAADAGKAAELFADPATRRDPVLERLLTARL
ncbi:AfsR/SARP family transcriptional regulator [Nonomuraea basaltis]|uniref:AfsR/SARP family transcriptional regulator n=1 Tax=Nonomuraea basaltis TaxID=2495887 RepID=UPI00110C694F|nr:AfsR/SARP family transcriptional regulator [Nonomuraea basaltis]TMR90921.1 tetratricopeptide repeat protein [Nonomuraea basaltis]